MKLNKKILFLNWVPSPYRVDFFNLLNEKCKLKVIYFFSELPDRSWGIKDKKHDYSFEILFPKKQNILGYIGLVKILLHEKYDHIILSGYSLPIEIISIFTLRVFRKEFTINSDGGFISSSITKNFFKKILISSATYWLASGHNAKETLIFYGAKPSKTHIYHFTSLYRHEILQAPVSLTEKNRYRLELGIEEEKKICISIGQYIKRKGMCDIITAMHLLKDKNIHLYIIGEGPLRAKLQSQIEELNLAKQVFLCGPHKKDEVLKYCKAADLFILAAYEDIWGLVINEAISCGLPVVTTTKVGAAYSLVENGSNGFMIKPGDIVSMKDAIIASLERKKSMSIETVKKAKLYSLEQMVEDHIDFIKLINN
jgi:glycosyltransferase involved in cell wall biosynthesis